MGMSADDIEGQNFPLARKGYDRAEVERFRAKVAKRVRKLERKLQEARDAIASAEEASSSADESAELTRHIGEILKLAAEQAERATEEARAEAAEIIAAARSEAASATEDAEAARRLALDAIEAVRIRVAETIEVELGLHDELDTAAATIRGEQEGPTSSRSTLDPLAQVVSEAVDRASTPKR